VLIVGHQPSLGSAAAIAMTRKMHYWCVKKGSIWWLASRIRAEEEQAIIRAVITPDLL
jgi:phosphohistidine phosphatase